MVFLLTWMFWTKCLCPPLENHLRFPPWEHSWPLFRHLFLFKLYYEYLIHVPLDHWVTDECCFHCYFIVCHLRKWQLSLDTFYVPLQIHTSSFPFLLCPGGCPLPPAPMGSFAPCLLLWRTLWRVGDEWDDNYSFPVTVSPCHAAVSSDCVPLKSKVSIGQSSPTALWVPLSCPSLPSLFRPSGGWFPVAARGRVLH